MKKILGIVLILCSVALAGFRAQGQASLLGVGYGVGVGVNVVPLLLDVGVEGAQIASPVINSKGTYHDDRTGEFLPYEGKVKLNTTRVGGYLALHFPGINLLPVLGALANPVLHFGTQRINMAVEGEVRLADNGAAINENIVGQGSYFLLGFPAYLGPLFIEPAFGSQHIFIPQYANYKNSPEVQLSLGLSF